MSITVSDALSNLNDFNNLPRAGPMYATCPSSGAGNRKRQSSRCDAWSNVSGHTCAPRSVVSRCLYAIKGRMKDLSGDVMQFSLGAIPTDNKRMHDLFSQESLHQRETLEFGKRLPDVKRRAAELEYQQRSNDCEHET